MKRANKWICMDCAEDTKYEHYFIHTDIWLSVVDSVSGMLCVGCLERRLGRELTAADFTDAFINRPDYGMKSARLLSRLGSSESYENIKRVSNYAMRRRSPYNSRQHKQHGFTARD